MKMKDPKTTIIGSLMIAGAVISASIAYLTGQQVNTGTLLGTITAGIGLIHASDSNK